MSKAMDRLFIAISARADRIETLGFWIGFVIPPINQAIYGDAFPAPYFIVVALLTVNIAKVFIEFFECRLTDKNRRQLGCDDVVPMSQRLEAGLALFKALGLFSIGLALAGLLTYLFLNIRSNQ